MGIDNDRIVGNKLKALGIGRFQVMALLQAARYYLLKKNVEKAKSFGLNRAIFYAWAKHHAPRMKHLHLEKLDELLRREALKDTRKERCPEGYIEELGECVKISPRGYFVIGEQEQTPYDFDQQVTRKISRIIDPDKAWEKALEYVSSFPRWVLEKPQLFYKYVYEPVRDMFFKELILKRKVEPPREVINRLKSLDEMLKKIRRQKSIMDFAGDDRSK